MKNTDKADKLELISKLQNIRNALRQEESPIISEMRQIYFDANLEYINCCENTNGMHYHPSSKHDKRMEKLVDGGKTEQVRILVIKRLDELIGSLGS